jgi:DNA-binding beta-propeller fold protein YncE
MVLDQTVNHIFYNYQLKFFDMNILTMNFSFRFPIAAIAIVFMFPSIQIQSQSFFSEKVEKLWETHPVFQVPESVFYNPENEMIYVANINGKPTDRDGNGFLSLLQPNGKIERIEWVTGLHAPKGMSVFGDYLYVADIYRVGKIDFRKGAVVKYYETEEAKFLNDVIADEEGNIYITDMANGSVYRIADDNIEIWLSDGTFDTPNGIYFLDGQIYLGAKGSIVSIDPSSKEITQLVGFEGSVDGLEIDTAGNFIFSDWSGMVRIAQPGSAPEILFNTTADKINAADIHLIRNKNILLVPTFFDNRVAAYLISINQ